MSNLNHLVFMFAKLLPLYAIGLRQDFLYGSLDTKPWSTLFLSPGLVVDLKCLEYLLQQLLVFLLTII